MLQNEYLIAKIGVDTEEKELSKVCRSKRYYPPPVINLALATQGSALDACQAERALDSRSEKLRKRQGRPKRRSRIRG